MSRFDRVEADGGSILLSKRMMEIGYGCLQPFARLLIRFRITPNQISWAAFILGGISGVAVATGNFGIGAVIASVSAALDAVDGMVARMTGASSSLGEILDAVLDRYVDFFLLGGMAFAFRSNPVLLVLCLFALSGGFMMSYSTAKAEAFGDSSRGFAPVKVPRGIMRRPERMVYLILGCALTLHERVESTLSQPLFYVLLGVAVLSHFSAFQRISFLARSISQSEVGGQRNHGSNHTGQLPRYSKKTEAYESLVSRDQQRHISYDR